MTGAAGAAGAAVWDQALLLLWFLFALGLVSLLPVLGLAAALLGPRRPRAATALFVAGDRRLVVLAVGEMLSDAVRLPVVQPANPDLSAFADPFARPRPCRRPPRARTAARADTRTSC